MRHESELPAQHNNLSYGWAMTERTLPVAVVASLPVINKAHASLPVIFFDSVDGKRVEIYREALEWANSIASNVSPPTVQKRIKTLCRFLNFFHAYSSGDTLSLQEQTASVYAYVDFRVNGTRRLANKHPLKQLDWKPISRATARIEFVYLSEFLASIGVPPSTEAAGDRRLPRLRQEELTKLGAHNNCMTQLFAHLRKQRHFWEDLRAEPNLQPHLALKPVKNQGGYRPFPTEEEIREIIGQERNPAFKALWLLLTYGASHRISEALNIWQVDVLPASYRAHFFPELPHQDSTPFVLIAHPSESDYVGKLSSPLDERETRTQYLRRKYSLAPRNKLAADDPLYSGFKAKRLIGNHKVANTWWLNLEAASLFEQCAGEIWQFHLRNRTSRLHPYFFVNMFAKSEAYGQPIRMRRIQDAWSAACKRVGITANKQGRNIHGLRHFSKYYAKRLGISSENLSIIRGDMSLKSQEDYGVCASDVHQALANRNSLFGEDTQIERANPN